MKRLPRFVRSRSRREFLHTSLRLSAAAPFLKIAGNPILTSKGEVSTAAITVHDVIQDFLKEIPGAPFANTVDTIKSGNADTIVTGIVTTMFATHDVIVKSHQAGANFIIAHEPTFYNHLDETNWLEKNNVFAKKESLLQENNIVVWRCHDSIHRHEPDGVLMGVLEALTWDNYYDKAHPNIIRVADTNLGAITVHIQKRLEIPHLKIIGEAEEKIKKIALLPGAAGGRRQIEVLQKEEPDLLIVGELNEWETAEYVRDARRQGKNLSLIVLGHAVSEEPGMKWMANWLRNKYSTFKVRHIPAVEPFRYT